MAVLRAISAKCRDYLAVNLLPTMQAIITLVKAWWNISYTVPGMKKWLHRNGFSYKKPAGFPHRFNAEAQQAIVETLRNAEAGGR